MSKLLKALGLALLLVIAIGGAYFCETSFATIVHSVDCTFEPISVPEEAGLVKLELAFTPKHECDEVTVKVSKLLNAEYTGDTLWVVPVEKGKWYRQQIEITIPPNDTSGIEVTMVCGRVPTTPACYFVTTEETVEVYAGKPSHKPRRYSQPATGDPVRDTLTMEQLKTEYEVAIDLHDPAHMRFAEKLLGKLPDTCEVLNKQGIYIMKISLDNILKLAEKEIELDTIRGKKPSTWSDSTQKRHSQSEQINIDTLSPEQLQREHEVMLWLRDSTERKLVEQVVGPMQDSLQLHGRWSIYRVKMTLEKFLEIKKHDVDVRLLKPGQWWHQTPRDSVPQQIPQDTSKSQGVLDQLHKSVSQSASITLDHVDGLTAEDELTLNQPISG